MATGTPTPTVTPTATVVFDGIVVEFRTTARAYVEASVDGQVAVADTLPEGTQRTLRGTSQVIMRVSNGSSVEVILNGQRQEPVGTTAPVELTWRR